MIHKIDNLNDWVEQYNRLIEMQEELARDMWKLQERYYQIEQHIVQIDELFKPHYLHQQSDSYYSKE